MFDTSTRVAMVRQRAKRRRRRREHGRAVGLCILCITLVGLDVSFIACLERVERYYSHESWMFGAMMMFSDAGGYVLVATISTILAVAITILCVKYHEKKKRRDET